MKEIKIAIAAVGILIVILLVNSSGFTTPFVQATTDDGNNEQASSDDGNDAIPFVGDLLPQLSPSNEKVIQSEETQPETTVQSDNLQNPSIQNQVNQTPTLSQEDVQLQSQNKIVFRLPNGDNCYERNGWGTGCTSREATNAYNKYLAAKFEENYKRNNNDDKLSHFTAQFPNDIR